MKGFRDECVLGNGGIFGGGSVRSCTGFECSRNRAADILRRGPVARVLSDSAGGEDRDFVEGFRGGGELGRRRGDRGAEVPNKDDGSVRCVDAMDGVEGLVDCDENGIACDGMYDPERERECPISCRVATGVLLSSHMSGLSRPPHIPRYSSSPGSSSSERIRELMLVVSVSSSPMPRAFAAASRSLSRSSSSSSCRLLARTALSLISMTSVSTIGCGVWIPSPALAFVLCWRPMVPMRGFMLGVLRANVESASEAAPRMLPRRRVDRPAGCDGGTDIVGEAGGVTSSVMEGAIDAADIDCIVCGRFEVRRDNEGFNDPNADGGDVATGEYVTNEDVSTMDGCAAKGSATV